MKKEKQALRSTLFNFLSIVAMLLVLGACREQATEIIDNCTEEGCPSDPAPVAKTYCDSRIGLNSYNGISGSGEDSDPYIICHAEQLESISLSTEALTKSYRLVQDIDMTDFYITGSEFQLGSCGQTSCDQAGPGLTKFTGSFDGAGNTISGFSFVKSNQSGSAFIAFLGSEGKIVNTIFSSITIEGNQNIGSVVGRNEGEVLDVEVIDGTLTVPALTVVNGLGGIVGNNAGLIKDSETRSTLNVPAVASPKKVRFLGGIAGINSGQIKNSINEASISNLENGTGGIVGLNLGTITKCTNIGTIEGSAQIGGIAGVSGEDSRIYQSVNTAVVTKNNEKASLIVQKFDSSLDTLSVETGSLGSGVGEFFGASDIAIDTTPAAEKIFILEKENHRVQIFNLALTYQGTFGSIAAGAGQLLFPMGIDAHTDNDYVLIANTGNNIISKFNSITGAHISNFLDDDADNATVSVAVTNFKVPHDVAIDASENIFIADTGNNRIVSLDSTGGYRLIIGGTVGNGDYNLNQPQGIAVDASGKIYVADTQKNRVQVFASNGIYQDTIPSTNTIKLNRPTHITVSGTDLFITDSENNRIVNFSTTGSYKSEVGKLGSSASDFNLPAGVATDGTSIYVVDSNPSRVGGIAGFLDKGGIIQNSYNTGSVVGSSTNNFSNDIGGVVGYSKGLVSNTYSTGNIDGGINLGGLVGYNAGQLEHSFSTGSVTGDSDYYERVGPLLGHQDYLNYGVSVSNYFQNNWTVTAGSTCLSASVGVECNSAIALGNSLVSGGQDQVLANFYDGQEFPFRDYNGGSPIIYWDFTNIWDETATFPTLKD